MKQRAIARFLLVIFVTYSSLACTTNDNKVSSEDQLLDKLSQRFNDRDFVDPENMGFINPHEQLGQSSLQLIEATKLKLYEHRNSLNQTSPKTFGIQDEKNIEVMSMFAPDLFRSQNMEFDSKTLEKVNAKLNEYSFSSDGVLALLNDAEKGGSLTRLQQRVIKMQFQEFARAKSEYQVRAICASVEYEVIHSGVDAGEADEILRFNAVLRNASKAEFGPLIGQNDFSSFQQGNVLLTAEVVLYMVVFWGVGMIIGLFFCDDPGFAQYWGGDCIAGTMAFSAVIGTTVGVLAQGTEKKHEP